MYSFYTDNKNGAVLVYFNGKLKAVTKDTNKALTYINIHSKRGC